MYKKKINFFNTTKIRNLLAFMTKEKEKEKENCELNFISHIISFSINRKQDLDNKWEKVEIFCAFKISTGTYKWKIKKVRLSSVLYSK